MKESEAGKRFGKTRVRNREIRNRETETGERKEVETGLGIAYNAE